MHLTRTHGIRIKTQIEQRYEERASHPEKYPEKCPFCKFRGFNTRSISLHVSIMHPKKLWLKNTITIGIKKEKRAVEYSSPYDKETMDWIAERSLENMLLHCNGKVNKLTSRQIKTLKKLGIVELKWPNTMLTSKGQKIWAEIKNG